jgi:hypothetical protein
VVIKVARARPHPDGASCRYHGPAVQFHLGERLPVLLASPAAARQTTPTTRATTARVVRCAPALDAGWVMVPRMLGSDLAGSVKYMIAAMIAKTAMIARMAAAAILPVDRPRVRLA